MSSDLRTLLEQAAPARHDLPSVEETWAAGRARRRTRMAVTGVASALAVVVAFAVANSIMDWRPVPPEVVGTAPDQPTPSDGPGSDGPVDGPVDPGPPQSLSRLAVASTISLADGRLFESRFPDGIVRRAVDPAVSYPQRIHGLEDGTVVWQAGPDVFTLTPGAEEPTVIVSAASGDPSMEFSLVGLGEIQGGSVALILEGNDDGGTLWAYRFDADRAGVVGNREAVLVVDSLFEYDITSASLGAGWLVYTEQITEMTRAILRSPDGAQTEITAGERVVQAAVVAPYDLAPGVALFVQTVDPASSEPYGDPRLEIRDVRAQNDSAVSVFELPHGNIPKQLTVAGEWAFMTLLPDEPQLLQVDLHSGAVSAFDAPGIMALHGGLRGPVDEPAPAACADDAGVTNDDAQAYVWLPCPDAASHDESDDAAGFHGIQRIRLVTDERASSGGIDQRIDVMLREIFAGPTDAEFEHGYRGIIGPEVAALNGVSAADGVVTIDLSEEGARAVSIGTSARAVFGATVQAAIFGGFVDAQVIRFTVDGDCTTWATYGEGEGCTEHHRDGTSAAY